jgi:hypothetical protein
MPSEMQRRNPIAISGLPVRDQAVVPAGCFLGPQTYYRLMR